MLLESWEVCCSNVVVYVLCRSHILQADSEADCYRWISAIQEGAAKAYNKSSNSVGGAFLLHHRTSALITLFDKKYHLLYSSYSQYLTYIAKLLMDVIDDACHISITKYITGHHFEITVCL